MHFRGVRSACLLLWLGCGPASKGTVVRLLEGARNVSLLQSVQNSSEPTLRPVQWELWALYRR